MSECYCDYDGPAPSVYRKAVHTARTQHKCYECGRKIQPGERYENCFAVYDGAAVTSPTCSYCLDLRECVNAHVPCLCWSHGNIREECIETAQEYAHEAPGLLFGAYRREVRIVNARKAAE